MEFESGEPCQDKRELLLESLELLVFKNPSRLIQNPWHPRWIIKPSKKLLRCSLWTVHGRDPIIFLSFLEESVKQLLLLGGFVKGDKEAFLDMWTYWDVLRMLTPYLHDVILETSLKRTSVHDVVLETLLQTKLRYMICY